MNPIKSLSNSEYEALLRFPVYISLLAANSDGILDEAEKTAALKFSKTKTYSAEPLLAEFFREADAVFESNLEQINHGLPQEQAGRDIALKSQILIIERIVRTLGKKYASAILRSMTSYREHVSKAHHSVVVDFILPIPIPGLTQ
jgi:hypothetical protein